MPPITDHRPLVAAQRRDRMRAHLIHAALQAVVSEDSVSVSLDTLLTQAQVARGTFYKYFPDVPALMQTMAIELGDELIAAMHPIVQTHADDPARGLAVGMTGILHMVAVMPALGKLLACTGWPVATVGDAHAFYRFVQADLRRGLRRRRFTALDANLALDLVAGQVIAAAHRLTMGGDARRLIEQAVAAMLRSLGIDADEASQLARLKPSLPSPQANSLLACCAAVGEAG